MSQGFEHTWSINVVPAAKTWTFVLTRHLNEDTSLIYSKIIIRSLLSEAMLVRIHELGNAQIILALACKMAYV